VEGGQAVEIVLEQAIHRLSQETASVTLVGAGAQRGALEYFAPVVGDKNVVLGLDREHGGIAPIEGQSDALRQRRADGGDIGALRLLSLHVLRRHEIDAVRIYL